MYRQKTSPPLRRKSDSSRKASTASETNSMHSRAGSAISRTASELGTISHSGERTTYTNEAFVCEVDGPESDRTRVEGWKADPPASDDVKKEEESLGFPENFFLLIKDKYKTHRKHVKRLFLLALFLLYNVYLGFAIHSTWNKAATWCDGSKFLVLITSLGYVCAAYSYVIKPHLLKRIKTCLQPFTQLLQKIFQHKYFSRIVWSVIWTGVLIFLVLDTSDDRYRLVSAAGLLVLLFLGYIFSKHRSKIMWRHLQWGMLLQFLFGIMILRWNLGKDVFQCLGDKVKSLLDITDQGSAFVFGYLVTGKLEEAHEQPPVFAFKVLTVIVFFSFLVSLLYYYGVMQVLVAKVGWLLQHTVGTTAGESMNAAANIFLSMNETPLLIRPYLSLMTKSELHAVMTGGFATIAGSVLAAYISFGINASHLLSASVMSAPAALAYSKLIYPETEESCMQASNIKNEKGTESNALEAATNGACATIKIVSNIAANLIAFVAFIGLLDTVLGWMGSLVQWDFLSFEWLLSKLFIPLSLLMGVDWKDKEMVANLVGLKTVVNEFVAYKKLGDYQKEHLLSARSEAIATYALCGFSNIGSIGIQIGTLSALAPDRKSDVSQLALRAMIAGSAACFMTACVAGTLLKH